MYDTTIFSLVPLVCQLIGSFVYDSYLASASEVDMDAESFSTILIAVVLDIAFQLR